MDKDFFSRNIGPFLAAAVVLFAFLLFWVYSRGQIDPANKEVMLLILGAITGTLSTVVNYYFGSSKDSQRKTELLAEQAAKPAPAPLPAIPPPASSVDPITTRIGTLRGPDANLASVNLAADVAGDLGGPGVPDTQAPGLAPKRPEA